MSAHMSASMSMHSCGQLQCLNISFCPNLDVRACVRACVHACARTHAWMCLCVWEGLIGGQAQPQISCSPGPDAVDRMDTIKDTLCGVCVVVVVVVVVQSILVN